ncbi:MAG TPA: hypothetical protein DDY58_13090 [Terrisporobacter glycolicus]|uniref:glycosyltransferase n=1 Tax=Terrisporobacter TaxID=1505652 RepID=UPI000E7DA7A7|nr:MULTISPECIES: glycosyltransferase [Terrisporobacter]HBI93266.1 hypothetical protein [Terrisporobacter hibernicus]
MRKNIIILSHNNHSFLNNEIKYASQIFEKVIVVCPYNQEFRNINMELPNVELLLYKKKELYMSMLTSLLKLFNKENIQEFIDGLRENVISKSYIKVYLHFIGLSKLFSMKIDRCIGIEESKDWIFYSAWYYSTAYAVTEAKKRFKYAKVVSLAHSFEVDKIKNKFTHVLYRKKYHNELEKISFISENVFKKFENDISKKLNLRLDNIDINMLGTTKLKGKYSDFSKDNIIRIVSCSHIVPIKRLDLILNALDYTNLKIEWTHIGDGKERKTLEQEIINNKNKNLKINLLGALENKKIHEFYVKNKVDIFINLSESEGIPVSIMEAIAYGIPVIATDVGGNSEIVKNDFGRLVSKNPTNEEIKKSILDLVNIEYKDKIEMRRLATEFFENNFDSDKLRPLFFANIAKD